MALGGSAAAVCGFCELLLHGLRCFAPELMQRVRICWQGEAILSGPSEYRISVFTAGRRCSLEAVQAALPAGEHLQGASQVMAALMHIGDVFALASDPDVVLFGAAGLGEMHRFAMQQAEKCGAPTAELREADAAGLRLLAEGCGAEHEAHLLLTDTKVDTNRKVKRAFCEPGNVGFCPLLSVVSQLLQQHGAFLVRRKPEHGEDVRYTDLDRVQQDFASGDLHPGELKPAVAKGLNSVLTGARASRKSSEVLTKALKDLRALKKQ